MRPAAVLGQEAERRAVRHGRQHRAGGEVDAQADHIGGADAAGLEDRRDRLLEDLDVVVRVLQRPIRFQPHAAGIGRQALIDHAVGVGVDISGNFAAVGDIDEQRPARLGAEIDPDCVFWHGFLLHFADVLGRSEMAQMGVKGCLWGHLAAGQRGEV